MVIVGHGLVVRQIRGPATATGAPEQVLLMLRRYRCRACKAVLIVGPPGVVVRRWYGAGAIALAIAVFARGETSASARARTSPARTVGASALDRWSTLVRWIDAAQRGSLFGVAGLAELERRQIAHQVTLALAARGGHVPGADLVVSAFAGAALAA